MKIFLACSSLLLVAGDRWPDSLEFLSGSSSETFLGFVAPLASMTGISYIATYGSYWEPEKANETVSGFERGTFESNPTDGGMRALTFLNTTTGLGVVAFRGTDTNISCLSGRMDMCADAILMGTPLESYCSDLNNETLDYFTTALAFTETLALIYPEVDWMFTGHSLGAQLAELVAAVRGATALAFASDDVNSVLRARTALDVTALPAWRTVALFNQWDPLRFIASNNLPGAACVWPVSPAPAGCQTCDVVGQVDFSREDCGSCFQGAHVYNHYLDLLASGVVPTCSSPVLIPETLSGKVLVV